MHSLGGYPGINVDEKSSIEIEIYEVSDPNVLKRVYQLENYSGTRNSEKNWYDTVDVSTSHGLAEIFYFKEDLTNPCPLVNDGVWK